MAFKMKGYSAGKGTGSALKQNYSPIDKMVLRKEAKMYQKKDGDKLEKINEMMPQPPDPDREDGGIETDAEHQAYLKRLDEWRERNKNSKK